MGWNDEWNVQVSSGRADSDVRVWVVCDVRDIVLGLLWDKKYFVLYTCTHTYIIHLYTCMHVLGELPSLGAWKRGRHRHCPLPLHFLLIRFNLIRYCILGTAHSCVWCVCVYVHMNIYMYEVRRSCSSILRLYGKFILCGCGSPLTRNVEVMMEDVDAG